MKRSLLFPLALIAVAACSENQLTNPGDSRPIGTPSFLTGSGASFTAVWPGPIPAAGTCFNGPGTVNCNIYSEKDDVALNAGPDGAALEEGTYFFAVMAPGGGQNDGDAGNLSDDVDAYTNRTFDVDANGVVTYAGTHASLGDLINLADYATTPNNGGVYILAICEGGSPADESECKFDAFKVDISSEPPCTVDCPGGDPDPEFAVIKYYDANLSGTRDGDEALIAGWAMQFLTGDLSIVLDAGLTTADEANPLTFSFPSGSYMFRELISAGWFNTDPGTTELTKAAIENGVVAFGNVCVGAGGGKTLGFWSNKNGAKILSANGSAVLNAVLALPLRTADGELLGSVSLANFQKFLLEANATNMANMLSAQLAAMKANVVSGGVSGSALIYAPGTTSANSLGFATVNDVMAEAAALLAADGVILAGDSNRALAESLKNALDNANNNLNFVQPTQATCPAKPTLN